MRVTINKNHIKWVNNNVDIKTLLGRAGRHIGMNGKLLCPFHLNTDTPAAKYYSNSNQIMCFAEHRRYGSYDVLTKILKYTPEQVLELIPKDLWYSCDLSEIGDGFKVPVVNRSPQDFQRFIDYVYYLDLLWYDIDKVETKPL